MSLLGDSASLFVEIGLDVWLDQAVDHSERAARDQRETEAAAALQARLRTCVTQLQRIHEIDAQRDLLRVAPSFPGKQRSLDRLEDLRQKVLRGIRHSRQG